MHIICNTSALTEAVLNAQMAAGSKTTSQILEGLLFEAEKDIIRITGYNQDLGIITEVPAETVEEGRIVINAKILGNILRLLPYDKVIIKSDDKLHIKIESANIYYDLMGMQARDFPELPQMTESDDISIQEGVLKDMIRRTVFSAAVTDVKAVHKGIKFEVNPGELVFVAIDSHRLAIRREFLNYNGKSDEFVVPSDTMQLVAKLAGDGEDEVLIKRGRRDVRFIIGSSVVYSRLLDGEFMKYASILPKDFKVTVRVNVNEMIAATERTSVMISERIKAPLKLDITDEVITISTETESGSSENTVSCEKLGDDLNIGVQSRFLLEALRAAQDEVAHVKFNGKTDPICIMPVDNDSYYYLILPVRL